MYHINRNETAIIFTDARQVRTRRTLLDALLTLLETRAFEQVTIREIARQAGIGYATFFRHYPSKDALLHDLAAGEIAALLARALPILFGGDARQSCATLFHYVDEHRALWSALLTGGAATTLKQEFTDQALRIDQKKAEAEGWLPNGLRVIVAISTTVEIIGWWLAQEPTIPVEKMAEIVERLVLVPAMAVD